MNTEKRINIILLLKRVLMWPVTVYIISTYILFILTILYSLSIFTAILFTWVPAFAYMIWFEWRSDREKRWFNDDRE